MRAPPVKSVSVFEFTGVNERHTLESVPCLGELPFISVIRLIAVDMLTSNQTTQPLPEGHSTSSDPELANWAAFFELLFHGELDELRGRFVAVFDGEVVGSGNDPDRLRHRMAAELSANPAHLVVAFVDNEESIAE